jgi:transcriptional regulator with XRE-family HTH domain
MRRLRLEQDITQEDLAFKAGLHRTFVSELEIGHRNPTYANLLRVANALGVSLSEWIAGAEASTTGRRRAAKPRSRRASRTRTTK